jgi:hypothetical protein
MSSSADGGGSTPGGSRFLRWLRRGFWMALIALSIAIVGQGIWTEGTPGFLLGMLVLWVVMLPFEILLTWIFRLIGADPAAPPVEKGDARDPGKGTTRN